MSRTIYFGYGSNMWLRQMALRCPDSAYLGLGRLQGWRLQINQRGYCNVVQRDQVATSQKHEQNVSEASSLEQNRDSGNNYIWEVYGVIYSLSEQDEAKLDVNEGVPVAYTKEIMPVEFWPATGTDDSVDVSVDPEIRRMLVYVDRTKTIDSLPKTEYIFRMNRGIEDALRLGMPSSYIKGVVREFIAGDEDEILNEKDRDEAERQAREFRD